MQVLHPRCAGLDVHQKTVVVTAMITQQDGTVESLDYKTPIAVYRSDRSE